MRKALYWMVTVLVTLSVPFFASAQSTAGTLYCNVGTLYSTTTSPATTSFVINDDGQPAGYLEDFYCPQITDQFPAGHPSTALPMATTSVRFIQFYAQMLGGSSKSASDDVVVVIGNVGGRTDCVSQPFKLANFGIQKGGGVFRAVAATFASTTDTLSACNAAVPYSQGSIQVAIKSYPSLTTWSTSDIDFGRVDNGHYVPQSGVRWFIVSGNPFSSILDTDFLLGTTTEELYFDSADLDEYCAVTSTTTNSFVGEIAEGAQQAVCRSFAYLFIPNKAALNQYTNLPELLNDKIPFSFYFDVKDILLGSNASSSVNFEAFSINFPTTTGGMGNILPTSFTFLSSTTIMTYISPSLYNAMFLLMRSAIWITVMFVLYRRIVPYKATI